MHKAPVSPYRLCAGTDEAGRGPLAGDVVAAAVILREDARIDGLADSKKLSPGRRELLYDVIIANSRAWAVARATVAEIDALNIRNASLLAMERAVSALATRPEFVYVDGNCCPPWNFPSTAVVKGDSRVPAIAAASVLAKVTRDREMATLDSRYPGYGFARHKGYATAMHLQSLKRKGPCEIHRRSFAPVQELISD